MCTCQLAFLAKMDRQASCSLGILSTAGTRLHSCFCPRVWMVTVWTVVDEQPQITRAAKLTENCSFRWGS